MMRVYLQESIESFCGGLTLILPAWSISLRAIPSSGRAAEVDESAARLPITPAEIASGSFARSPGVKPNQAQGAATAGSSTNALVLQDQNP